MSKSDTRTRLLEAAMSEFIEAGYAGTDTNRIARRAGYAPQTFYRCFKDKATVLAEVLTVWDEAETAMWRAVLEEQHLTLSELAEACVDNIRPFLTFRFHLRSVQHQEPGIALQRTQGRRRLLQDLAPRVAPRLAPEALASLMVQIDQLAEAIARGEFSDMGLSGSGAQVALTGLIGALRGEKQGLASG